MRRLRLADPLKPILLMGVAAFAIAYAPWATAWGGGVAPVTPAVATPWPLVIVPTAKAPPTPRIIPAPQVRRAAPRVSVAAVARRYGVSGVILRRVLGWRALAAAAWPGHAALVLAVVAHESRGIATAIGYDATGQVDRGLMQVGSINDAATGLTRWTAMQPVANVRAGVALLRAYIRAQGSVVYGLEQYNGGLGGIGVDWTYPAAVLRWRAPLRAALAGAA